MLCSVLYSCMCLCVFCVARGTTVVVVVEVVVSDRRGKFDSIVSVGEGGTKSKRALDWFAPFTSYR